jgi:hypothetical protein
MGLRDKVKRLEEQMSPAHWSYEEWPIEAQIQDVLSYFLLHVRWDSIAACTDQQLYCIGLWLASQEDPESNLEDLSPVALEDFPEEVVEHVSRLEPRLQAERDVWLREQGGYFVRMLEEVPARLAEIEEQRRRRSEESRRRDRELLKRNRELIERSRAARQLPLLGTDEPESKKGAGQ